MKRAMASCMNPMLKNACAAKEPKEKGEMVTRGGMYTARQAIQEKTNMRLQPKASKM